MSMVTILGKVAKYPKDLSPIKKRDSLMTCSCEVTWQIECIWSLLKNNFGHQTRQSADSKWETPILKITWSYDCVINVRSRYKWSRHTAPNLGRGQNSGRRCKTQSLSHHPLLVLILRWIARCHHVKILFYFLHFFSDKSAIQSNLS